MKEIIGDSLLTCPACDHEELLTMPTNACQWFHECSNCHLLLKPKKDDCCVFCSYGSVSCPPIQLDNTDQSIGGCGCGKG